jgi:PTH1 family peptidyl-tRNA hydrolase
MNVSGPAVRQLMAKYGAGPERLLLVFDELALPWGTLRVRPKGSAGGHHGVESVIRSIAAGDFARVRLGIHPGRRVENGAAYVLAAIRRGQREELDSLLDLAAQAAETIIAEGVEKAMTKFNRRARGLNAEEE